METLLDSPVNATFIIVAVCIGVSLPGFWALKRKEYQSYFLFIPSAPFKGKNAIGALVSHFAHGDFGHLAVNMLALVFFGPGVERELGPVLYLVLYGVSGIVGTFAIWIFRRKNERHSALGASGAIAGVLFASVVIVPGASIFVLFIPIPIPAPVFAVLYLVLSSVMMGRGDRVAHEAHIGGALAGFAIAALLYEHHLDPLIRTMTRLLG